MLGVLLGLCLGSCFDPSATEGACCRDADDCGGSQVCKNGYCLKAGADVPALACNQPDPTAGTDSGTASGSNTSTGSGSDTSTSGTDTGTAG